MNQNSEDEIYYYVEDLLLNHESLYNGQKVKTVKIHRIKPISINKFDIEFSVEVYTVLGTDSGFIPDKGRWLSSYMRLDATDIKVQRDIKINNLLKPR